VLPAWQELPAIPKCHSFQTGGLLCKPGSIRPALAAGRAAGHHRVMPARRQLLGQDPCRLWQELRGTPRLLQRLEEIQAGELRVQTLLRREFPAELVRLALTLRALRQRAADRFTLAARMWFDRQGLEQATTEIVARHKALRFAGTVWDLCCGIGGDALALAGRGRVLAADISPLACLFARWNMEAYGVGAAVDVLNSPCEKLDLGRDALLHIDPDRRAQSGRAARIEEYVPGPAFLQQMMHRSAGGAIKLGPAANFLGRFPDCEVELVSLHGECKEATVWYKALAGNAPYRATVLPAGETIAGHPLEAAAALSAPRQFICEPDPAVVRAGLVDHAAAQLGLARLDQDEEYLTGDAPPGSRLVRAFELVAQLPYSLHALRRYFRQSPFGQVEIKCRRIRCDVERMRRQLPLPGDQPAVVILARAAGKAQALVCRRHNS